MPFRKISFLEGQELSNISPRNYDQYILELLAYYNSGSTKLRKGNAYVGLNDANITGLRQFLKVITDGSAIFIEKYIHPGNYDQLQSVLDTNIIHMPQPAWYIPIFGPSKIYDGGMAIYRIIYHDATELNP